MEVCNVTPSFTVAPQIQPSDAAELAAQGFVAIVCNRPDGEGANQPSVAEMREAAETNGLAFHHIPVAGGQFRHAAVSAFRAVRRGTEGPLLAYCRTGMRSITLDTLANPDDIAPSERLMRAADAGYDLTNLSEKLI